MAKKKLKKITLKVTRVKGKCSTCKKVKVVHCIHLDENWDEESTHCKECWWKTNKKGVKSNAASGRKWRRAAEKAAEKALKDMKTIRGCRVVGKRPLKVRVIR